MQDFVVDPHYPVRDFVLSLSETIAYSLFVFLYTGKKKQTTKHNYLFNIPKEQDEEPWTSLE